MLVGRLLPMIVVLAIGGSLGRKKVVPATAGTFPTATPLFGGLLLGVVIIVVGLTYFPVVALGPVVEHLVGHFPLGPATCPSPPESHPQTPGPPARDPAAQGAAPSRARRCSSRPSCAGPSRDAFVKLDPRQQLRNPVMFVVLVGSVWTTVLFFRDLPHAKTSDSVFVGLVAVWLWFTVLFANFAEAVAEGRGKAQADTLRKTRSETVAHVRQPDGTDRPRCRPPSCRSATSAWSAPGELIPGDGDVVEGIASVDESAITGESAPVIRESGGDRSAVTGGTRVLSDGIVVQDLHQAGRELHRPDDRPGGRGQPAEDAQRDRPQHPAGRADHHLPAGRRHPAALRPLLQRDPERSPCWSPCWCA